MNTITIERLRSYFEKEQQENYDYTKLLSGHYAAFRTQLAFEQYKRGFNLYNLYAGDNK